MESPNRSQNSSFNPAGKRATWDGSRREFLGTATALGTAVVGSSLGLESACADTFGPSTSRGQPGWKVEAARIEQTFGDGSVVPFFRFLPIEKTPAAGILPKLEANAGQAVSLTIENTLAFAIQPMIVDHQVGPIIQPGETKDWLFNMPPTGTWLMTDALLGPVAGSVGLAASITSRQPAISLTATSLVPYHYEYTLLYQDADDRWNYAVDAGEQPDTSVYEPNFHTLNGLTFPDTIADEETLIRCAYGRLVLLRLGNLGHVRHVVHFHGYHARMLRKNNLPETSLPEKDSFPLPGHTTAELLLPVTQPGLFPLHPHNLTSTTDNGFYPNGQITLIDAT